MENLEINIRREECFRQVTEDVSRYQWALSEWFEPTVEYSDHHLLLEIFTRRSRAIRILAELCRVDAENKQYTKKLYALVEQEDEQYKKFIRDNRVRDVFGTSIPEILKHLRSKLKEIINIAGDATIYDDESLLIEELPEVEKDFLQLFTRLYYVRENHRDLGDIATSFCNGFDALEADFRKNFHYFLPIAGQMAFQGQIYAPSEKEWWYRVEPDCFRGQLGAYLDECLELEQMEKVKSHLISCDDCKEELHQLKKFNEMLSDSLAGSHRETGKECPSSDDLCNYAIHENAMTGYQKKAIEDHISLCSHCLSDVIYFRAAEVEDTPEPVFKPIPFAIKMGIFLKEKTEELKGCYEKIREIVEIVVGKKTIYTPALAMCMGKNMGDDVAINNILSFYKIQSTVNSENRVILLKAPEDCPVELKPLSKFLDGQDFYYKVFGIYKEGDKEGVGEICFGSEQYLPIAIERPDTNYLIVCLSIDENTLNDKANHLLKVINNRSEEKIENLICLLIEIVENV